MWFDSHTRNDRKHRPATARYANWQSGEAESLVTCGFDSHPCYFKLFLVPWSSGNDSSLAKRKRGFDSLRDDWEYCHQEVAIFGGLDVDEAAFSCWPDGYWRFWR